MRLMTVSAPRPKCSMGSLLDMYPAPGRAGGPARPSALSILTVAPTP
jgi:hypothetical protein